VWVLMGDDQWILQKTIDVQVQKLLPNYRHDCLHIHMSTPECLLPDERVAA